VECPLGGGLSGGGIVVRFRKPDDEERMRGVWFYDWYTPDTFHAYRVGRTLVDRRTKFQHVVIQESPSLGLCLILDGKIQSVEADEYIYHELLVHPAMTTHPAPRTVLILGGGEGATLREVLRHPTVESVTMVDIDEELVDLCRTYLPSWHQNSFEDPRVKVVYEDARRYLAEHPEQYDVIINDVTDPVSDSASVHLFTREFYGLLASRLREGGIVVAQALGIRYDRQDIYHAAIHQTLRTALPIVRSYAEFIFSFDSLWGFVMGSFVHDPLALSSGDVDERLAGRNLHGLRFYDGQTHTRIFHLPKVLRRTLEGEARVIDDATPLTIS